MSRLIAVGSDYEVFVRPIDSDQVVSAIPLINADKERRVQLKTCEIHHDNVLAEVNITPSTTNSSFVRTVEDSLNELSDFLLNTGHTYVVTDSVVMNEKELRHVDACEFGCSEDYDIIRNVSNIAPSAILAGNLRTAGGHIHVSYTFRTRKEYRDTALLLSTLISLGTTIMGDSKERRVLYGKAGSVRLKEYGVEVRSPSNVWLTHKEWIGWIYRAAAVSCKASQTSRVMALLKIHAKAIANAVDACCVEKCTYYFMQLSKHIGLPLPPSSEELKTQRFINSHYGNSITKGFPLMMGDYLVTSPEEVLEDEYSLYGGYGEEAS